MPGSLCNSYIQSFTPEVPYSVQKYFSFLLLFVSVF